MKRCPECGLFSDDDASFCPRCGRMLPELPDPEYVPYQPAYQPVRRNRGPTVGAVVGVIIVAAILLGAGIMYLDRNSGGDFADKTVTYRWSLVDGYTTYDFEMKVEFSADEMKKADSSRIDRWGSSTNSSDHSKGLYAVSEYVVVSDSIKAIAESLWENYNSKVPAGDQSTASFADYILTYVQVAVDYEYDSTAFGQDEYWQYPIETLYRGYGDCEDTSILAAAIYSHLSTVTGAKDFISDSAVLLLPGHAMVGVKTGTPLAYSASKPMFTMNIGTSKFYFGETTYDGSKSIYGPNSYVGYISSDYYGSSILGFTGTSSDYV